jgi:hypothetical protein
MGRKRIFGRLLGHVWRSERLSCSSPECTARASSNSESNNNNNNHTAPAQDVHTQRWCLRAPLVLAVHLLWSSNEASSAQVAALFARLSSEVLSTDLFMSTPEEASSSAPPPLVWVLRGLIGFLGAHYVAFSFNVSLRQWVLMDDRTVSRVGSWAKVVELATRRRIQPILLFFERNEDSTGGPPRVPHELARSMVASQSNEDVQGLAGGRTWACASCERTWVRTSGDSAPPSCPMCSRPPLQPVVGTEEKEEDGTWTCVKCKRTWRAGSELVRCAMCDHVRGEVVAEPSAGSSDA